MRGRGGRRRERDSNCCYCLYLFFFLLRGEYFIYINIYISSNHGGWGSGGRRSRRERERGGKRSIEKPEAKGRVQALPLRGDREAGGALDNEHAEMVRSFQQPFVLILAFDLI